MKYGICNMGLTSLDSCLRRNDENGKTFSRCHYRLDLESSLIKLIRQANYKTTHISYSIFHISKRLKGAS